MGVPRTGPAAAVAAASALLFVPAASVHGRAWSSGEAGGAGGTIVGVVTTNAAAPAPIRATIDPGVCGQTVPNDSIVVDAAGHLANVYVAVPGVKGTPPAETLVANEKCRFSPRVSILRPGGAVKMTSRDPVLHTMHAAAADGRAYFNISIPMPNITLSRPIDRPGVVTLSCSTHTWMRGYLHVADELATLSGADGQFSLQTNNLTFRCKPLGLNQLRHTPVAQHPLQLEDRREFTLK